MKATANQRKIMSATHQHRRIRWKRDRARFGEKDQGRVQDVRVGVCNRMKKQKKKQIVETEKKESKIGQQREILLRRHRRQCCRRRRHRQSLHSIDLLPQRSPAFIYMFYGFFFSVSRIISHSARRGLVLCCALLFSNRR